MLKKTSTTLPPSLHQKLLALSDTPPAEWDTSGVGARPNLHGILRYPAMMVPCMQGDIIDAILVSTGGAHHIIDPFVGSGTTLTESLMRGINFTGIDINPLAALVCEAKLAIDRGADFESAANSILSRLADVDFNEITFDFDSRAKWFDDEVAKRFSTLRRLISDEPDQNSRKILWVVFAETVRLCSNSRTSTYKLHKRAAGDEVHSKRVITVFTDNLKDTVSRVCAYRISLKVRRTRQPDADIICGDIRNVKLNELVTDNLIMVTSPPYGDNVTTITYGQFSYLALQWIPLGDLPLGVNPSLFSNTHSIDSASLGGSKKDADNKREVACLVSPTFASFVQNAFSQGKLKKIDKVATFIYDYFDAASQVQSLHRSVGTSAHWVMTTGNRTAAGIVVPFDIITREIVEFLGGREIISVHRKLPSKRMPSRNSLGSLINTETTLIAEFR